MRNFAEKSTNPQHNGAKVEASNLAKIGRIVVPARAKAKFTWILPSVADNADSTKSKPKWWNGRHEGLKIPWPQGCAGSSPAFGTKNRKK